MNKSFFFILTVALVFLSSCAKVYFSPDAKSKTNKHQIIALVPPKVTIAARKKVEAAAIQEQQKAESVNFQNEMYAWLLKRKMQNRIFVEVLDVETTNAKLKKAGYFDDTPMSPAEIAEVLGVDAVLTSTYSLTKPMSDGGALALGLLVGVWGSTNNTTVTLEIHDKAAKKLLWNYNHKVSGSIGSSPAGLVDNLMRNASKKMPYYSN